LSQIDDACRAADRASFKRGRSTPTRATGHRSWTICLALPVQLRVQHEHRSGDSAARLGRSGANAGQRKLSV